MDPSSSGSGGNSLPSAAGTDARKWKVCYFYDPEVGNYYYGQGHPMMPHRVRMTHELVTRYGLLDPGKIQVLRPEPACDRDLRGFHSDDYVAFLRTVTPETQFDQLGLLRRFNVGEECPVFDGLYSYCHSYAGSSLAAASMLNGGYYDIAINWSGGLHHAKKSEASGFCYVNDIVLAILELLKIHERVLYVDIDIHHGDGVEEAFYTTNRVMTVSFHKYGSYFPGTGNIRDIGYSEGKYYCLNVPLDEGIDDESYQSIFKPIISKVMQMFRPGAIVLQCGADSLSGDRLGCFNLSGKGHAECVKFMRSLNVPLLLLGGGGYTIRNVARCWCNETAVALGEELDDKLPLNEYYAYFGPEYRLHVASSNMENKNTRKQLEEITVEILDNLSKLPHAPSVQFQERIPEAELPEPDEDQEDPDERHDPDSDMVLDDHKPLEHSARRSLIESITVEREFTETQTKDQNGNIIIAGRRGPEMMAKDIGSSKQAAVTSEDANAAVPWFKLSFSRYGETLSAPSLQHLLLDTIRDAVEFSIQWATLGRHRPQMPSEWSWWTTMGSPFIQLEGICSIAATVMCVEAQHRLAFETLYGMGTFPLKAKRLKELKEKCVNRKVWRHDDGAMVEDVLQVVAKGRGVEATHGIFLPIDGYHMYKNLQKGLSHEAAAGLLLAHGPLMATLWADGFYITCTEENDFVYRGNDARGKHPNHTVVCFAYRFIGEELHLRILDNHTEDGPVRWVLYDAIDELYVLTLKNPLTRELIGKYMKKGEGEDNFLTNSEKKAKAWLIRRKMNKYLGSEGSSSDRKTWAK